MALSSYTKTVWANGTAPAINDTNLNKMETGIFDVTEVAKANESAVAALPTTYQAIDAATAKYDTTTTWGAALKESVQVETYAATIELDFDDSNHFATTLTGNLTLSNPLNTADNEIQVGFIILTQDATGGHTLTLGTNFTWDGTDGTSTTADKINVYRYTVIGASTILIKHIKAI